MIQTTSYPVPEPGKMILKLCKHFRHKVPAEFSETAGRVDFQPGLCFFSTEPGLLLIRIEGENEQEIARLHYIIGEHLARFVRVEGLQLDWQPVS